MNYAYPDVLVSTADVAAMLHDTKNIRIIESNEDVLLYSTGHIPGAVRIDWVNDLQDQTVRDYIGKEQFAELCSEKGITNETTVIFYGDKSNWWACYALWVFKLYGHTNCKIMDGGRAKWIAENRDLTKAIPVYERTQYTPTERNMNIRALLPQVLQHTQAHGAMVDVRSPQEYSGETLHMPDYPQEGALRGGHIPGASSMPWSRAVKEDATFKSADELHALYVEGLGLNPNNETIAYCRIGERSSHTWFVLTYLLGFTNVKNYDGSWTEWGNVVGLPIEKGNG
ncbi:MAG: sulfurtransferase [Candidatus Kapabacteria bacterium]|nr:sulfurtransferase [Candidatus Kapabacteria bacterium]